MRTAGTDYVRIVFAKELEQLKSHSEEMCEHVVNILSMASDSFWTKPASATGVHHPETSNGIGGNIMHTKQAFWILSTLLDGDSVMSSNKAYLASGCSAILLHDICKFEFPLESHGYAGSKLINDYISNTEMSESCKDMLQIAARCVAFHMGKWGDVNLQFSNPTCRYDVDQLIVYVHQADYISSRPYLLFNYKEVK